MSNRTPLAALLGDLHAAGIRLRIKGDRIAASPRSALTPDLRNRLRFFQEDVLEALQEDGDALLPMFAYGTNETLSESDARIREARTAK